MPSRVGPEYQADVPDAFDDVYNTRDDVLQTVVHTATKNRPKRRVDVGSPVLCFHNETWHIGVLVHIGKDGCQVECDDNCNAITVQYDCLLRFVQRKRRK